MLAKKLAVLTAAMALAAPALADHGHRYDRGNHYGHYKNQRHYYHPAPRQVVVVHRPAPVIYRPAPVVYQPAPVYHARMEPGAGAALLVGAVLGAAVVHAVVTGH